MAADTFAADGRYRNPSSRHGLACIAVIWVKRTMLRMLTAGFGTKRMLLPVSDVRWFTPSNNQVLRFFAATRASAMICLNTSISTAPGTRKNPTIKLGVPSKPNAAA
jgi:hypothetical protein